MTLTTVQSADRDLDALFDPRSIAVIGASDDQTKYGNWIAVRALRGARPVHLINRTRGIVLGREARPSLRDVGEQVDLVVIAVPAAGFSEALSDALSVGAKAIIGISGGLGEAGEEGRRQQERFAAQVREAGACLLGPNCLGVLDHTSGLELTSNDLPAGEIGLISQSGNMALELSMLVADHGLGFSRFASLGNQADIDAADLIDAYVSHEGTRAIALYCEDFPEGRRFVRAAHAAHLAGKPVVMLAVGRGAASARGARSHTGALVTPALVVDAACRAAGVEQVSAPTEMAHLLQGLLRTRPPRGRRVAIFADGGGQAAVASDCAEAAGLAVEEFSPALTEAIGAELPPAAGVSNPVDVAGGGEQDISCFTRITRHLLNSAEVDAVLVTGYFGGYGNYSPVLGVGEREAATAIADLATGSDTSLVFQTMNWRSPAADLLRTGGVPVYRSVEDAVHVLSRLARRADHVPTGAPEIPTSAPVGHTDSGYFPARRLLADAGLALAQAREVHDLNELRQAAGELHYPLVLKALGDEHKSDRGGVVLGIRDAVALEYAWTDVQQRLRPPSCSVEEMAELDGAVELLVGVRRDRRFGPVVLVGMGGVYAEVLSDIRCALGPLDAAAGRALLTELRGAPLLTGGRGRPVLDLDAAGDVIARLSQLAARHPEIAEIECNPVAVSPSGAICLDARIVLETD